MRPSAKKFAAALLLAVPSLMAVEYETASVRINNSGSTSTSSRGSQGQVTFTNQTLKRLIERAYGVQPYQVTGPSWLNAVRSDIVAKYPEGATRADRPLMLRSLLVDRFRLRVHPESGQMSGYAMMPAKGGFRLKPVVASDEGTSTTGGVVQTMKATSLSVAGLAAWMMSRLGQPIVDRSGVAGVYDFEFRWTDDDSKDEAAAAPSLFTAIEETLGLRFHAEKVPVEVLIVDSAEKAPEEN